MEVLPTVPADVLHIILEYDGRIQYRGGAYVNVIRKDDCRYAVLTPHINAKIDIVRHTLVDGPAFYMSLGFTGLANRGLCYASGPWAVCNLDQLEICYFNFAHAVVEQIRTCI